MNGGADRLDSILLGGLDPDVPIWRYLTFPKFVSLLATRALWFSKLRILTDALEGTTPALTRRRLKGQHAQMEGWFQEAHLKQQVRNFVEQNEGDGRELIVVNCWFISPDESKAMWDTYAENSEGVVVRSTPRDLANSLAMSHRYWWLGQVEYVDFAIHDRLSTQGASQAHLRAFLKSDTYSSESELRIATMNWVAPGCLNPDGSPQNETQRAGLVYSTDRRGIFVEAHLPTLIKEVRSAPGVSEWQHDLIELLINKAEVRCRVERSRLAAGRGAAF